MDFFSRNKDKKAVEENTFNRLIGGDYKIMLGK
jgi:hypothetical protein